jgi:hypothetical protein
MQSTCSNKIATMLLAIALTLSGMLPFLYQPLMLKIFVLHFDFPMQVRGSAIHLVLDGFGAIGILGWLLALGLSFRPCRRRAVLVWPGLIVGISLALLFGFDIWDSTTEHLLTMFAFVIITLTLATLCQVVFLVWYRSLAAEQSPLFLFGFAALGAALGPVGYQSLIDPSFILKNQWLIGTISLAIVGILFFAVGMLRLNADDHRELSRSVAPTWLRRLRWVLLGGLPACIVFGVTTYVSTEISPIPDFWLVPLAFYQIAWVVAFARMTNKKATLLSWLLQILTVFPIHYFVWVTHEFNTDITPGWVLAFFGFLSICVYMPHRFTLTVQSGLLAMMLLQIFAQLPFQSDSSWSIYGNLLIHLAGSTVIFWGCAGDAVKTAPDADRLPEFLLCTQGGFLVCSMAFLWLPAIVFPRWVIEYPLALVACLIVRALPWHRWDVAQEQTADAIE